MEVQIKRAVKAGNSSAVVLPRAWLNKEVRVELVEKNSDIILADVLEIARKNIDLKHIIGIYLVGSYARGEESSDSDIDILIVTDCINKDMINEGIYNVLIVSSSLIEQKLKHDLFPIGQMIREAEPLLNRSYLNSIKVKVTKENIRWYLDTTEDKLKIIKKIIDKVKKNERKYLEDKVAYTLVLRIRTLYIIEKLIENKSYSKKQFVKEINKVSGGNNAYEGYLAVKNDSEENKRISVEETVTLYDYLENKLIEIKKRI